MTHDEQPRTVEEIANAGADAIARWRASKRVMRATEYRRRMEQPREPDPLPWLQAVELDDAREPELAEVSA